MESVRVWESVNIERQFCCIFGELLKISYFENIDIALFGQYYIDVVSN